MSGCSNCLSTAEISAWRPQRSPAGAAPLVQGLQQAGFWTPEQLAGRRWPVGCVALEITQRCNLDCKLCYLSEQSEAVRDVPLTEVFRRIEMIYDHYGPDTDVQVSGGDPTLRRREELVAIVRRIGDLSMRPSLFTNGIKATRGLLRELAENGLVDVAFHVDSSQNRRGFNSEAELNRVRLDYIERVRGLPLSVFFNTTVFADNFHEIPDVVRFFTKHADVVRLASFQLQADTGRGVLRERPVHLSPETVSQQINAGVGTSLNFDAALVGHPKCNRYAMAVETNGRLYDVFDDPLYINGVFRRLSETRFDRRSPRRALVTLAAAALRHPGYWWATLRYLGRKAWQMRSDLIRSRGRLHKLSFFIHNFMDADHLDRDRCQSCIFMVATQDGPLSMCVHNAKRDAFILEPLQLKGTKGRVLWDPLTGAYRDADQLPASVEETAALPRKFRKGRARFSAEKAQETAD